MGKKKEEISPIAILERNLLREREVQEEYTREFVRRRMIEQADGSLRGKLEKTKKNITLDNIKMHDRTSFAKQLEFRLDGETISKEEILLKSPYITYLIEESLEEKHIIFLHVFDKNRAQFMKTCKELNITDSAVNTWRQKNELFAYFIQTKFDEKEEQILSVVEDSALVEGNVHDAKYLLDRRDKIAIHKDKMSLNKKSGDEVDVIAFDYIDVNAEEAELIEDKTDGKGKS